MKLYVLVRDNLSKSQQGVQAGHAVAEIILRNSADLAWNNGTLVYLKANKTSFDTTLKELEGYTIFREPDIGNTITALALLGTDKVVEYFKNFKLV